MQSKKRHLSPDILSILLSYADYSSIAACQLVCADWRSSIAQTSWKCLYFNTYRENFCNLQDTLLNETRTLHYEMINKPLPASHVNPPPKKLFTLLNKGVTPAKWYSPRNFQKCLALCKSVDSSAQSSSANASKKSVAKTNYFERLVFPIFKTLQQNDEIAPSAPTFQSLAHFCFANFMIFGFIIDRRVTLIDISSHEHIVPPFTLPIPDSIHFFSNVYLVHDTAHQLHMLQRFKQAEISTFIQHYNCFQLIVLATTRNSKNDEVCNYLVRIRIHDLVIHSSNSQHEKVLSFFKTFEFVQVLQSKDCASQVIMYAPCLEYNCFALFTESDFELFYKEKSILFYDFAIHYVPIKYTTNSQTNKPFAALIPIARDNKCIELELRIVQEHLLSYYLPTEFTNFRISFDPTSNSSAEIEVIKKLDLRTYLSSMNSFTGTLINGLLVNSLIDTSGNSHDSNGIKGMNENVSVLKTLDCIRLDSMVRKQNKRLNKKQSLEKKPKYPEKEEEDVCSVKVEHVVSKEVVNPILRIEQSPFEFMLQNGTFVKVYYAYNSKKQPLLVVTVAGNDSASEPSKGNVHVIME